MKTFLAVVGAAALGFTAFVVLLAAVHTVRWKLREVVERRHLRRELDRELSL